MIVIISNWGLADGTLVTRAVGGDAAVLTAIHRAVIRGGFHPDGGYRPVRSVDVVLAGDTFDWLVTSAWCRDERPWHRGSRSQSARLAVARRTLVRHRGVVGRLVRWARVGLPVPPADARDRPRSAERMLVPVRLTALAGDRDPWLDQAMPGTARRMACGICWSDGTVDIRHGHEFDAVCRRATVGSDGRVARSPSLAESVATDLVARFGSMLRGDAALWPVVAPLVAVLAPAGPAALAARLGRWSAETDPSAGVRERLERTWRTAVARWHAAARLEVPACEVEFDAVDALATCFDAAWRTPDPAPDVGRRLGLHGPEDTTIIPMPDRRRSAVLTHRTTPLDTTGPVVLIRRAAGVPWTRLESAAVCPVVTIGGGVGPDGDRVVDAA